MLRQKWGSVVCPGCNNLVGVRDDRCLTCGRWNPGLWGFGPALTRLGRDLGFTPFVMTACGALFAVTFLYGGGVQNFNILLSPGVPSLFLFGASGTVPVFEYGRWWTVFTAGWLHGNIIHIAFNMMSIRNLAPIVADYYGASRMAIIYLVSSATGFLVSSLVGQLGLPWPLNGGWLTVGASAGITGLVGAILFYAKRTGNRHIDSWAKSSIIGFLIMGLVIPIIDNWAHLGGLAGGYVCSRVLDPLYPERIDHLLIALVLMGITIIAFVAGILHGLPLL